MINSKQLLNTIEEIILEKQIKKEIIINSIKEAIKKAYEKHFDPEATINVEINEKTGEINVTKELLIVKKIEDDLLEIEIEEAKKKYNNDELKIGDIVHEKINSEEFSRLAIIQIGQIIKQQIKEAEKESIFEEYINQEGNLMRGIVIASEEKYLLVEVERTFAYISNKNLIFSDNYDIGQHITFLAEEINKEKNLGQIIGTRTSEKFLLKLLEREIPEIFEKIIEVKSIAREPGIKSKIAVISNNRNIEPIGTCIGIKRNRISKIIEELNNEKIDICIYSENIEEFIINSLSPVKIIALKVFENNDDKEKSYVNVIVPNEQFFLAIGKKGNTVKLVAKLTKWKINIIDYSSLLPEEKENLNWNGNITKEELNNFNININNNNNNNNNNLDIIEEKFNENNNKIIEDKNENYNIEDLSKII